MTNPFLDYAKWIHDHAHLSYAERQTAWIRDTRPEFTRVDKSGVQANPQFEAQILDLSVLCSDLAGRLDDSDTGELREQAYLREGSASGWWESFTTCEEPPYQPPG